MSEMTISVSTDFSNLEARLGDAALEKMQTVFAQKVLADMNKHCPEDSGALKASALIASRPETGDLVWNTPYAKHVHELDRVYTVINADAVPHWTASAKELYGREWLELAGELLEGN